MSEYFVGTTGSNSQTTFEALSTSQVLDDLQLNTGDAPTFSGLFLNSTGTGANNTIFSVDGSNGRLFGVTDEVTGTVFSVNDAAGLPILEVESTSGYDKITIGEYGSDLLVLSGQTSAQVTGSQIASQSWVEDQGYITDAGNNFYLTGIEKSSNTLNYKVQGASDVSYTFGSNAFTSTTIPSAANDATITISAGTALGGGGNFTTDQSANETITINHDSVSRSDTTESQSLDFGGTFTGIDSITSNAQGHITAENTVTYTLPSLTSGDITGALGYTPVTLESDGSVEAEEFIGDLRGAVSFRAKAGEALSAGEAVYISGIDGNSTVVAKADADDSNKMPAFGVAGEDANANSNVSIVNFGEISNLDTSDYSEGDELFISTTAGLLTGIAPAGESAALQKMAKVTRSHASSGSITVMGAGRSNAVPNLNEGRLFVGNSSNQAVADGTVHVDIANSRVGINNATPAYDLDVSGDLKYSGTLHNGPREEYVNSNIIRVNQRYTGGSIGSYFEDGEYQKVVTITPDGSSQNYQIVGKFYVQSGAATQTIEFDATLRSETLPDLGWEIYYNERHTGTRYIKPVLWTKETSTAAWIIAFEVLTGSIYGSVTADIDIIPRSSDQKDNVVVNTTTDSEQTSVESGFTQREYELRSRWVDDDITIGGNLTSPNLTLTGLSSQASEATALMINGSNVVGTRELGSNAFTSTTIPSAANDATITLSGGTEITTSIGSFTTDQSTNETLTINHANVSRSDTTSTASPAFGATFTVVDAVTSNARGHVTAENVKTITLPSLGTTSTTALAGNTTVDDVSEANLKSRLAALDSTDTLYIGDAGDDTTVVIRGTLQVDGTTTTVNSTTLTVDDKNIELGSVSSPTDSTADGGGITLKGATDKTLTWVDSTDSWTSNQTFSAPNLTLTSLSTYSGSDVTALMINGSNIVGKRTLGSAAFSATGDFATAAQGTTADNALPKAGGTMSGDLTIAATDPTITLRDSSGANTDPNGTIIFSEVSGTTNFDINYNGANDRLEFRGLITSALTDLVHIKRDSTDTVEVFGNVTASSLIKSGGTSSQFLKADGSVDSNSYSTTSHNHTLDSLSNVTITSNASGEILKWSGSAWVNNTLSEAGICPTAGSTSLTTVGTISTGTWNGSVIASAYLDADTAHLSGTQTFSGAKTFSSTATFTSALDVSTSIRRTGDTDTYINFGTSDQIHMFAGGRRMISLVEGATDSIIFNDAGVDVDFRVEANGEANALFVQGSDGNVGIGSSTPDKKLVVRGADSEVVIDDTNSTPVLRFRNSGTTAGYIETNSSQDMKFHTGGVSEAVRIDSSGNVGIGTTSPNAKLEVNDNVRIGNTSTGVRFYIQGVDEFRTDALDVDGNGWNSLHLRADGTDGLFLQKDTNNVGIGTTSPDYELHVIGTASFTDTVAGAYFEENASHESLKSMRTGFILVMDKDGELVPCTKENDTTVFGVAKKGYKQPIIMGAEPIKVTGPIKVGDFITTSNVEGHGMKAENPQFGTIIAQAMESGDGESYNIKAMIRKM